MSKDPDGFSVKLIILAVFIVVCIIMYPSVQRNKIQDNYNELQENYDDLEIKYDSLIESIGNLEDDIATVYCFLDHDEDITEEEAISSYDRIHSFFKSVISPDH